MQCERLTSEFGDIAHFSAGDLLREHTRSGTPDGNMVADMIKNGEIVPAEVSAQRRMFRLDASVCLDPPYPHGPYMCILYRCTADVGDRRAAQGCHGAQWEGQGVDRRLPA